MKTLLTLIFSPFLLVSTMHAAVGSPAAISNSPRQLSLPEGVDPEVVKEAGNKAVKDLLTRFLAQSGTGIRRFAVLPLDADVDGAYFTDQVRDQFAVMGRSGGLELYTRMDDEWNHILEEIGFGQKFQDTMDAASVQKFGRISGVQGLIMGRVVSVTREGSDAKVRFALRAFEVETGRLLWGGESSQFGNRDGSFLSAVQQLTDSDTLRKYWWIGAFLLVGIFVLLRGAKAMGAARRPR
jgi:hypothetical protein